MTSQQLDRANELNSEIRELETFIVQASRVWEGKLIQKRTSYIFKAVPYGCLGGEEFHMNTVIKDRILNVLEDYLSELRKELESL